MREIECRAWIISEKRMIYQPGILECTILEYDWKTVCPNYQEGTDPDYYERKTIPCLKIRAQIGKALVKLMQYIGPKDKNGKKIYEGDVVFKAEETIEKPGMRYHAPEKKFVVEFSEQNTDDGQGYWAGWPMICLPSELEVIGNIYENPELVKIDKE